MLPWYGERTQLLPAYMCWGNQHHAVVPFPQPLLPSRRQSVGLLPESRCSTTYQGSRDTAQHNKLLSSRRAGRGEILRAEQLPGVGPLQNVSLTPVVKVGAPPAPGLVHHLPGLSVLWEYNNLSSPSYGHCLLNDWFPMFLTMHSHLETLPPSFNIYTNPPVPTMYRHACVIYTSAWSQSPVSSLETLIQGAKAAGSTWIQFSSVLVGEGGHSRLAYELVLNTWTMPDLPSMFNTLSWRSFRNAMFLAAGVLPRAKDSYLRQSIVIVSKPKEDARECCLNMCSCHECPTFKMCVGLGVS